MNLFGERLLIFLFQNFESSCYLSFVWVKIVKKVPHTSTSVFDHFAGHPQGLCLVVCCCEFYLYLFGVVFIDGVGLFRLGGWVFG